MTRGKIITVCGALALSVTAASAQTDDEGLGWGPFYSGHLSPYDGRPLGPPLGALPPGSQYYNGAVRRGYLSTPGSAFGPERSYIYPAQSYYAAPVVRSPHAARTHRAVKR